MFMTFCACPLWHSFHVVFDMPLIFWWIFIYEVNVRISSHYCHKDNCFFNFKVKCPLFFFFTVSEYFTEFLPFISVAWFS